MKKLLCFALFSIAALAVPVASQAQNYKPSTLLSGGTNNIARASTNTYSPALTFACSDYTYVGIQISSVCTATNVMTNNWPVYRLISGTNYETTAYTNIPVVNNGTTLQCTVAEIFVPATGSIKIVPPGNAGAATDITNLSLICVGKAPKVLAGR